MNDRTTKYLCITLFLWIGFSLSATAAEATAAAVASAPAAAGAGSDVKAVDDSGEGAKTRVGTRTARLLDIQREGRAAGNMLPSPPAQAATSYQRYLDSFATPIPDQLSPQASPGSGAKR